MAVRLIAAVAAGLTLVLSVYVYVVYDPEAGGFQFREQYPLVRALGIGVELGADGISALMILLTAIIIFAGVFASWTVAGPRPGVLRAPPHARDRRVRRLRVPRPLRVLPLLRDRRVADVPPDRYLGLDRGGPAPGGLRLGIPRGGGRHQGIRGDEADPLPVARVGVHPGRHLRPLLRRRARSPSRSLVLSDATFAPATQRWVFLALYVGFGDPGRHLAAPHVVARRARLRAHRGLDAPRRRPDEARRLRGRARGDDAPPRGHAILGAPGGDRGRDQRRVRRLLGDGPDRSEVRRRLLVGLPHGARHAGRCHPDRGRPERLGLPDVRPRDHDGRSFSRSSG